MRRSLVSTRTARSLFSGIPIFCLGACLAGCRSEPPQPVPAAQLLGHRVTIDGRMCFDAERPPRVRVETTEIEGYTARWGSTALAVEAEARVEGVLLRLALDAPVGDATLELVRGARSVATWPVCRLPSPAQWPGLTAAVARRTAGAPAEAAALIEARLPALTGIDAVYAQMERGRAHRQQGDIEGAHAAWSAAADLAEAAGLTELAGAALRSTIWAALWRADLEDAAQRVERAAALSDRGRDPIGALRLDYNRALLARDLADYAGARRGFAAVRAEARRLGVDDLEGHAGQMQSMVLAALGRYREALEQMPPPGDGVSTLNRGWLLLQAMDAGAMPADHATVERLFATARAQFVAAGDVPFATVSGLNLAWLALRRGAVGDARARVEAAASGVAAGHAAAFAGLVDAELAAAEGRLDAARRAYAGVEAIDAAQGTSGWDVRWRAALGAARAARRMGDAAAALDAYRRALARLDVLGHGTGVREGRASFFADRAALVDEAIDALLAAGRVDEAFIVADRSRARVVRALEARVQVGRLSAADRAAWVRHRQAYSAADATLEALRTREKAAWREADTAALAAARTTAIAHRTAAFDEGARLLRRAAPIEAEGALDLDALRDRLGADAALVLVRKRGAVTDVFRVAAGGVAHARGDDPLAPWVDEVGGWRRLHLVADDGPTAEAVAAWPMPSGRPLAAEVALSRVPYAAALTGPAGASTTGVVVVADPRGDLPEAAREGRWVAERLGGRLVAGGAATLDAVAGALGGARVFHFAGHGDLRADDPWQAHLRLAGDGRLSLEAVLFHRPRVGLVVLSGCETGARLALARHEVIGLPEAFLAAGSRAVLATRRAVGDAEARRFVERFYAAGGADDPAEGLRQAARASRAAGHDTWRAFELWSR